MQPLSFAYSLVIWYKYENVSYSRHNMDVTSKRTKTRQFEHITMTVMLDYHRQKHRKRRASKLVQSDRMLLWTLGHIAKLDVNSSNDDDITPDQD